MTSHVECFFIYIWTIYKSPVKCLPSRSLTHETSLHVCFHFWIVNVYISRNLYVSNIFSHVRQECFLLVCFLTDDFGLVKAFIVDEVCFFFLFIFFSEWVHLFALQNLILLQNPKIIFPFKRYTSFLIALEMFSSHVLVCSSSWFTVCLQCKAKAEVQFFFIDIELLGVDLRSPNRKQVWNAARWQNACLAWARPWHSIPSTDKVGSEK